MHFFNEVSIVYIVYTAYDAYCQSESIFEESNFITKTVLKLDFALDLQSTKNQNFKLKNHEVVAQFCN